MHVCVRACACVCVRARVCLCVRACVCMKLEKFNFCKKPNIELHTAGRDDSSVILLQKMEFI